MEPKTARRADEVQASLDTSTPGGLCADTIVFSLAGEIAAGALEVGAKIITRDSGIARLREIRRKTIRTGRVAIKAGSLGHRRPPQDLILPDNTLILVRDWRAQAMFSTEQALVPAARLHDGEFVRCLPKAQMEVVELIFDTPHVLYAGGLEIACATPTPPEI